MTGVSGWSVDVKQERWTEFYLYSCLLWHVELQRQVSLGLFSAEQTLLNDQSVSRCYNFSLWYGPQYSTELSIYSLKFRENYRFKLREREWEKKARDFCSCSTMSWSAQFKEKAPSQTSKVNMFILQHHIMNNLQKPSSSPLVTKVLTRVVLLRFKNKMEMFSQMM